MWMPRGSYWTQPAGEPHVTSAKEEINTAFIEIDSGPYLVKSVNKAYDNGERPFNIHSSNITWQQAENIKVAPLWASKNGQITGKMIQFQNQVNLKVNEAKLVLIQGNVTLNRQLLEPGSLIEVNGFGSLAVLCQKSMNCRLYIKSNHKVVHK